MDVDQRQRRQRHVDDEVQRALEARSSTRGSETLGVLYREHPGSVFGEVAFFDGGPRSASVWAVKDSRLLRLDHGALQAFGMERSERASEFLFALGRVLAFRLRRGEQRTLQDSH